MKKTNTKDESQKVAKATRDAIVGVADRAQTLKEKADQLAQKAQRKWDESQPRQQKAKDDLKKATQRVVGFGKGVGTGLKEGFAEIQKRNKKPVA